MLKQMQRVGMNTHLRTSLFQGKQLFFSQFPDAYFSKHVPKSLDGFLGFRKLQWVGLRIDFTRWFQKEKIHPQHDHLSFNLRLSIHHPCITRGMQRQCLFLSHQTKHASNACEDKMTFSRAITSPCTFNILRSLILSSRREDHIYCTVPRIISPS